MIALETVVYAILVLIVGGIIFWLLNWLIDYVGVPEPFRKVARVVMAVGAVILVIAVLMHMVGVPLFRWRVGP